MLLQVHESSGSGRRVALAGQRRRRRSKGDLGGTKGGILSEAIDTNCQGLSAVSRAVDRPESTLCPEIVEVRTWVMGKMAAQQAMVMRMMNEMVMPVKTIR